MPGEGAAGHPIVATVPTAAFAQAVGPVDGVDLRVWDLAADLAADPNPDPDIQASGESAAGGTGGGPSYVVVPHPIPAGGLARITALPGLEVIQLLLAGYDHVAPHVPPGVLLCNAAGVHDDATAEHAVTLTLAAQRGLPGLVRAQARGEWIELPRQAGLADRRVMVLGYGRIGRAIASRLAPFRVALTAVASSARDGDDLVDRVYGVADLPELLPHQDVVVVITPFTPATEHLVDAAFLARMRDGALLVNVSRGRVVDTDALLAAARSGRIRAALDVTDPEPLPDQHPLFAAPGVIITPHVAAVTDAFFPRAADLVRRQLERLRDGNPPEHVVAG